MPPTSAGDLVLQSFARCSVLADRRAERLKIPRYGTNNWAWLSAKLDSVECALMESATRCYPQLYPQWSRDRFRLSTYDTSRDPVGFLTR